MVSDSGGLELWGLPGGIGWGWAVGARIALGSELRKPPAPATEAWGSSFNPLFADQEVYNNGREWCEHWIWQNRQPALWPAVSSLRD